MRSEDNLKKFKNKLLLSMLNHIPFDRWSWQALYRSAEDLKLFKKDLTIQDKERLRAVFDHDLVQPIELLNDLLDQSMKSKYSKQKKEPNKIPEKIKALILFRLQECKNFKESIRLSLTQMSLPYNSKRSIKMLYKTCDDIWRIAGDTSTDFSFYTKRFILSGVYTSTLMFWINDESNDLKETENFLERRLYDVSKIGKVKLSTMEILSSKSKLNFKDVILRNIKYRPLSNFFKNFR